MGQYWKPVNIDKREFIHPHQLGDGLKLREFLGSTTTTALGVLLAAMPERRGGGDLPDHDGTVVGRWAGDRIAIVGDYAEAGDIPGSPIPANVLYGLTCGNAEGDEQPFTDVTALVKAYFDTGAL
jgi:hypothetical protein